MDTSLDYQVSQMLLLERQFGREIALQPSGSLNVESDNKVEYSRSNLESEWIFEYSKIEKPRSVFNAFF